jgi:Ca2+-binding RTX toxin-like protein
MATFTGTAGADNFIGTAGIGDNFYFDISNLGLTDLIKGAGSLPNDAIDSLYLSGTGIANFALLTFDYGGNPPVATNHVQGLERLYLSASDSTVYIGRLLTIESSTGIFEIIGQATANDTIAFYTEDWLLPKPKVVVHTGHGNDIVNGWNSGPTDEFYGDEGDDHLSQGHFMDGGAGNDFIEVYADGIAKGGLGSDTIAVKGDNAVVDGGDGIDYISFEQFYSNVSIFGIEGLKISGLSCTLAQLSQYSRIASLDPSSGATFGLTGGGSFDFTTLIESPDFVSIWVQDATAKNYTIVGSSGHNYFRGGLGNNDFTGGNGEDTFIATGGTNTYHGGGGNDTLYGAGLGNLYGGAGQDKIYIGLGNAYGEDGNDLFYNDSFYHISADNAVIDGGTGYDRFYCDRYLDNKNYINIEQLIVGTGWWDFYTTPTAIMSFQSIKMGQKVTYFSGGGTVDLTGKIINPLQNLDFRAVGDGNFTFIGGTGNDLFVGGSGNDTFFGGEGNDKLITNASGALGGHDILDGGGGDDEIRTENLDVVVNGGGGDDAIYCAGGMIDGGDGFDTLFADKSFYATSVSNVEKLKIITSNYVLSVGISLLENFQYIESAQPLSAGKLLITLIGDGSLNLTGKVVDRGIDILFSGQTSGVSIISSDKDDIVHGTSFGDFLGGALGADQIYGGLGDDSLDGGGDNDLLEGERGNDTIHGGDGDDNIRGDATGNLNPGDDQLFGDGGDDTLYGGAGNDHYDGGTGYNLLDYNFETTFSGDTGTHGVIVNMSTAALVNVSVAGIATITVAAGSAIDARNYTDTLVSIQQLGGTGFDDILVGSDNGGVLYGNGGKDFIKGGSGADDLLGGDGDDQLFGREGDNLYYGGAGDDTYTGGTLKGFGQWDEISYEFDLGGSGIVVAYSATGNVTITDTEGYVETGTSIEEVRGSQYADSFKGNSGDDWAEGLESADIFNMGTGRDGVAYDREAYFGATQGVIVNISTTTVSVALQNGLERVIAGRARDSFGFTDTLISVEDVDGTDFDDAIYGNGDDNYLRGFDGKDILLGGAGKDTIIGGAGADNMIGGDGDDLYVVDLATDSVVETNSNSAIGGIDKVAFDGLTGTYVLTANVEILELVGTSAINGAGNALANHITGNSAANTINGGVGSDVMTGGDGSDIYTVDNVGDSVVEAAGIAAGISDSIHSSVTFTSKANVERLFLTGSNAINATGLNGQADFLIGNASSNTLTGLGGDDILNGGLGADSLVGGANNDTYYVDNLGDIVTELAGTTNGTNDIVNSIISFTNAANVERLNLTGTANVNATGLATQIDILVGNSGKNILTGLGGNDILIGGFGADVMVGGAGNDVIYVDNILDVATEVAGEGLDSIYASVSFVNQANVERLILSGLGNIDATGLSTQNDQLFGNAGSNKLEGLDGNDLLDGKGGIDTLIGGNGNDSYYVDDVNDVVTEVAGIAAGTVDNIYSTVSLTNRANVERVTLQGSANLNATGLDTQGDMLFGNSGANILDGKDGADLLVGGFGNDTLTGGLGNDSFRFDKALSALTNKDTITDYNVVNDTIQLDNAIFTELFATLGNPISTGTMNATLFGFAATSDANDRIIYNTTTGELSYDINGNVAGGATVFAQLSTGLALTSADFYVI